MQRSICRLGSKMVDSKLIFAPHGQASQFTKSTLSRKDLAGSPTAQFAQWFGEAQSQSDPELETCALATAELPSGRVSCRMVYLKELDSRGGFVVYSNWATSRKAADLRTNPHAALTFYWGSMQRQVRVEGRAERTTRHESQVYFDTRVRGSRIGAWASRQSEVLVPSEGREQEHDGDEPDDGRRALEERVAQREREFDGVDDIPVPEFWGGLRIVPDRVEFWQGRQNRLHDRFVYVRRGEKEEDASAAGHGAAHDDWEIQRLSP